MQTAADGRAHTSAVPAFEGHLIAAIRHHHVPHPYTNRGCRTQTHNNHQHTATAINTRKTASIREYCLLNVPLLHTLISAVLPTPPSPTMTTLRFDAGVPKCVVTNDVCGGTAGGRNAGSMTDTDTVSYTTEKTRNDETAQKKTQRTSFPSSFASKLRDPPPKEAEPNAKPPESAADV